MTKVRLSRLGVQSDRPLVGCVADVQLMRLQRYRPALDGRVSTVAPAGLVVAVDLVGVVVVRSRSPWRASLAGCVAGVRLVRLQQACSYYRCGAVAGG